LYILKQSEDNGFDYQITNIDGENKIFAIYNCNVNAFNALRTSHLFNTPNMSRSAYVVKDEMPYGKEAAVSLHRFMQPNISLTIGRNRRQFIKLDKNNIVIDTASFDSYSRQCIGYNEALAKTFRDNCIGYTEEQVKKETARCLGCGASVVESNKCIGCGILDKVKEYAYM